MSRLSSDRARRLLDGPRHPGDGHEQAALSWLVARLAAHEIGHVLLGSIAHERDGSMRATFDSRDEWQQPDAADGLSPSDQAAADLDDRDYAATGFGVHTGGQAGRWNELLNTQAPEFGGWSGAVDTGRVFETQPDGRVHIALPPWSVVLLGLACFGVDARSSRDRRAIAGAPVPA